jgi:hypothetical protein
MLARRTLPENPPEIIQKEIIACNTVSAHISAVHILTYGVNVLTQRDASDTTAWSGHLGQELPRVERRIVNLGRGQHRLACESADGINLPCKIGYLTEQNAYSLEGKTAQFF